MSSVFVRAMMSFQVKTVPHFGGTTSGCGFGVPDADHNSGDGGLCFATTPRRVQRSVAQAY